MKNFRFSSLLSFEAVCLVLIGVFSLSIKFLTDWYLQANDKVVTFTETIDELLTYGDMSALTVCIFLLTAFMLFIGEATIKNKWLRVFLCILTGFSVYLITHIFF